MIANVFDSARSLLADLLDALAQALRNMTTLPEMLQELWHSRFFEKLRSELVVSLAVSLLLHSIGV
jgi:hypothetical protein